MFGLLAAVIVSRLAIRVGHECLCLGTYLIWAGLPVGELGSTSCQARALLHLKYDGVGAFA